MSKRRLLYAAIVASTAVLVVVSYLFSVAASRPTDSALYAWRVSREALRNAAHLIGQQKFQEADQELERLSRQLPEPYRALASTAHDNFESALSNYSPFDDDEHSRKRLEKIGANETLGGYYRYGSVGDVCRDLGAPREAAEFYWHAVRAHPDDHYGFGRSLAWTLLAADVDEQQFRDLEAVLRQEGAKQECREALELLKKRRGQSDELLLEGLLHGESNLSPEDLDRLASKAKTSAQALAIDQAMIRTLSGLCDSKGRDSWEDKVLADFPNDIGARNSVYLSRADRADSDKDYETALMYYRKVSADETSSSYGTAQFNVATILQRQRKYDVAIAEYRKLISSKVNDRDPGGDIMAPYLNYRNSAAVRIAMCYEAKQDYSMSLELVEMAQFKYPLESFCINCERENRDYLDCWRAQLLDKLGRIDDALKLMEPIVFNGGSKASAFLVVEIYHRRHQFERLEQKIEEAKNHNKTEYDQALGGTPDARAPSYDGMTDALSAAKEYIALLRMQDNEDVEGLWETIEKSEESPFSTFGPADFFEPHWQIVEAVAALERLRDKAVPLLRSKLDATSKQQGWAFVLLARMKVPGLLADLKRSCDVTDNIRRTMDKIRIEGPSADSTTVTRTEAARQPQMEEDDISQLTRNLFYAMWLLDTPDAKAVFQSFLQRPGDNDSTRQDVEYVSWYVGLSEQKNGDG